MPMRKREAAFWTIFYGLTAGFLYYRWFQIWRESWPPPRYLVVGAALGTFVAFTHVIYHFSIGIYGSGNGVIVHIVRLRSHLSGRVLFRLRRFLARSVQG